MITIIIIIALLVLSHGGWASTVPSFDESLVVRSLPDGKVAAHFLFSNTWMGDSRNYDIFPKPIGYVTEQYAVDELHLAFTQGRWRNREWAYPWQPAPTGVELSSWFDGDDESVDIRWQGLSQALAGIFCGRIQQLAHPTSTSFPTRSFRHRDGDHRPFRYGTLSREGVCTENLTPWTKLLPCRGEAGIGMLLNPTKMYDVYYHSMAIHVRKVACNQQQQQQGNCYIELNQTLTVVFDRPQSPKWNVASLFGRNSTALSKCPLARSSKVEVFDPSQREINLDANPIEIELSFQERKTSSIHYPPILAYRQVTGSGERGGLAAQVFNNADYGINITYFEAIPWYLRIYFHTLKTYINGTLTSIDRFDHFRLRPAELRSTPSMIDLSMELPAFTSMSFEVSFEKAYLHYSEFPPDANRGFDIGSSMVTATLRDGSTVRLYTDNLTVDLPTPDFSMLYNVITLTCTAMFLIFGSAFNLSIKRWKNAFKGDEFVSDRPIVKFARMIWDWMKRAREKRKKD